MARSNMPGKLNKNLEDFVKGLKNIYGGGLVSVILYGSASSGEYTKKHSDINLAIVLDNTGLPNIDKASRLVNKYKYRQIKPIFFTERYIASSADVFPVEFLDIKENHLVLYGRDVVKDIGIDTKNLRFQCEQELKSKLIKIRGAYLDRRGAAARRQLLYKFLNSSLHILRNVLRLKTGHVPPYSKEDLVKEIAREFGMDASVMQRILDAKNMGERLKDKELASLFFNFTALLENIADAVDKL